LALAIAVGWVGNFLALSLCEKKCLHFSQFSPIFSHLLPMQENSTPFLIFSLCEKKILVFSLCGEIFSHMNRELHTASTYMFLASLYVRKILKQLSLSVRKISLLLPMRDLFSCLSLHEKIFLAFSLGEKLFVT